MKSCGRIGHGPQCGCTVYEPIKMESETLGIWKDPLKIEYRGVEMVVDWNSEIVLINIGNGNVMEFKVGGSIQVKKLDDCCKEYFNEVK